MKCKPLFPKVHLRHYKAIRYTVSGISTLTDITGIIHIHILNTFLLEKLLILYGEFLTMLITDLFCMDRIFSFGAKQVPKTYRFLSTQSEDYTDMLEQTVRELVCTSACRHSNTPLLLSN